VVEEGEWLVLLTWAEALEASGEHGPARQAIAEAHERLLARARRISRAEWRDAFLRMRESLRIVERWRAWQST
jgi:hypothetical protein